MKKIYFTFFILVFAASIFSVCFAQNPQLLGMTYGGGANSCGTIFKMNGDGSGFQTVYSFSPLTGKNPYGSLLQAADGKLYGMTSLGGDSGFGVLFRFDPDNYTYNDLFDFNDSNGANPYGSLIQATDGKLYGMTSLGGANDDGVLFSFNLSDSTYTKLIDFSDSIGVTPKGDLLQASNGRLYGMASTSGANEYGVLFSFDPSSYIYSKLVGFDATNGSDPYGSLIEAANSKLYGTTRQGGINSAGVLFGFNPADSSFAKLLDFAGGNEKYPSSSLLSANDGKFYGMTWQGGTKNVGSVYSFDTLGNIYNDVQDFDTVNGSSPFFNTLMQASNSKLYGMTVYGGANNDGVVFSFNPADSTYTKLVDFNDTNGSYPNGTLLELQAPAGIMEMGTNVGLTIYPNPVENELRFKNAELRIGEMEIYNTLGEVIYQSAVNNKEFQIDVSKFPVGVYFVRIKSATGSETKMFVKE